MHHTVHMFCKLNYHFYSALFDVLHRLSKTNGTKFHLQKDGTYLCYLLQDNGIMLVLRHTSLEDGVSYSALEIIMNPMRLIDGSDYLNLAEMKYSESIYKAFKKALTPIKQEFKRVRRNRDFIFRLDQLDSYKFKRVDFAVNFATEHVKPYMKLIRRANIPDGFQLFRKLDKSTKRYEPPKHSFYIFKRSHSKSAGGQLTTTIQCYDKGEQLKEHNLQCNGGGENIIRFEVQCKYNMVYRIIKANGLSPHGYSQFLREDISNNILQLFFKKTVGFGHYYTLSQAKDIIRSRRLKPENKQALLETLEFVNAKRGIWKARETLSEKTEFDACVKQLHKIGINPVTIPAAWGIDYLPCLFELFL